MVTRTKSDDSDATDRGSGLSKASSSAGKGNNRNPEKRVIREGQGEAIHGGAKGDHSAVEMRQAKSVTSSSKEGGEFVVKSSRTRVTEGEESGSELLKVVVRKRKYRERSEKVAQVVQKGQEPVVQPMAWKVFDLEDFVQIPDHILEVIACPRGATCRHDHSKYRVIGSKIYVQPDLRAETAHVGHADEPPLAALPQPHTPALPDHLNTLLCQTQTMEGLNSSEMRQERLSVVRDKSTRFQEVCPKKSDPRAKSKRSSASSRPRSRHCEEKVIQTTVSTVQISTSTQITSSTDSFQGASPTESPVAPPPYGYHVRKDFSNTESVLEAITSSTKGNRHEHKKESKKGKRSSDRHGGTTLLTKPTKKSDKAKKLMIIGKLNYLNVKPKGKSHAKRSPSPKHHHSSMPNKAVNVIALPTTRAWMRDPQSRQSKHRPGKSKPRHTERLLYCEPPCFSQKYMLGDVYRKPHLKTSSYRQNINDNARAALNSFCHRKGGPRIIVNKVKKCTRSILTLKKTRMTESPISPLCHLNTNCNAACAPSKEMTKLAVSAKDDDSVPISEPVARRHFAYGRRTGLKGSKPGLSLAVSKHAEAGELCKKSSLPGVRGNEAKDGCVNEGPKIKTAKTSEALLIKVKTKRVVTTKLTKTDAGPGNVTTQPKVCWSKLVCESSKEERDKTHTHQAQKNKAVAQHGDIVQDTKEAVHNISLPDSAHLNLEKEAAAAAANAEVSGSAIEHGTHVPDTSSLPLLAPQDMPADTDISSIDAFPLDDPPKEDKSSPKEDPEPTLEIKSALSEPSDKSAKRAISQDRVPNNVEQLPGSVPAAREEVQSPDKLHIIVDMPSVVEESNVKTSAKTDARHVDKLLSKKVSLSAEKIMNRKDRSLSASDRRTRACSLESSPNRSVPGVQTISSSDFRPASKEKGKRKRSRSRDVQNGDIAVIKSPVIGKRKGKKVVGQRSLAKKKIALTMPLVKQVSIEVVSSPMLGSTDDSKANSENEASYGKEIGKKKKKKRESNTSTEGKTVRSRSNSPNKVESPEPKKGKKKKKKSRSPETTKEISDSCREICTVKLHEEPETCVQCFGSQEVEQKKGKFAKKKSKPNVATKVEMEVIRREEPSKPKEDPKLKRSVKQASNRYSRERLKLSKPKPQVAVAVEEVQPPKPAPVSQMVSIATETERVVEPCEGKCVQFSEDVVSWELSPTTHVDADSDVGGDFPAPVGGLAEPQYLSGEESGDEYQSAPDEATGKEFASSVDSMASPSDPKLHNKRHQKKKKRPEPEVLRLNMMPHRRIGGKIPLHRLSPPPNSRQKKSSPEMKKLKNLLTYNGADFDSRYLISLRGTPVDLQDIVGGSPVDSTEFIDRRKKLQREAKADLPKKTQGPALLKKGYGLELKHEGKRPLGPKGHSEPPEYPAPGAGGEFAQLSPAVTGSTDLDEAASQAGQQQQQQAKPPGKHSSIAGARAVYGSRRLKKEPAGHRGRLRLGDPLAGQKGQGRRTPPPSEDWAPLPEPKTVVEDVNTESSVDDGVSENMTPLNLGWLAESVLRRLGAFDPRRMRNNLSFIAEEVEAPNMSFNNWDIDLEF